MRTNAQAMTLMSVGVLAWLIVASSSARAQDGHDGAAWPQFRGTNVDGVSTEQGVWSDVGAFRLEVAWRHAVGEGMSSVAVANDLAVTMTVIGDSVWVVALETGTGAERWRHEVAPIFPSPDGTYDGPMSTPLIAGPTVVALDRWGHLVGLNVETGDQAWSHDLPAELGTRRARHGFATSPILVEGTVVVQGGGADAMVVGFDPATGAQLWATGADNAVYQTPVPVRIGDRRQVVAAGRRQLIGIDPATGELLWQYAHGGGGITGMQSLVPVPAGPDRFFLAYKEHSSALIELTRDDAGLVGREQWEQPTIKNSYNVPVFHDGYIYGFSSRFLTCVDAATGEAVWKSRPPGDGFLILVDGHLVILTKDGSLHVAPASPEGYDEVAALDLFDDVAWATPSFANGHLYLRSYAEVARVDIRPVARLTEAGPVPADAVADDGGLGRFERFVVQVAQVQDTGAFVDRFPRQPHLAIGGITPDNIARLIEHGARGVAVCSAVCGVDRPQAVVIALREALEATAPLTGGTTV